MSKRPDLLPTLPLTPGDVVVRVMDYALTETNGHLVATVDVEHAIPHVDGNGGFTSLDRRGWVRVPLDDNGVILRQIEVGAVFRVASLNVEWEDCGNDW